MGNKHENIIHLFQWFVNDGLGSKEQALVLSHLSDCQVCQAERDRLQEFQSLVQDYDEPLSDYRFSFKKLMGRIEAAEKNKESTRDLEGARKSRWLPLGLAASVSSVAVIAWLLMQNISPGNSDEYTTHTTVTMAGGDTARLALTFTQPIRAQTMRHALVETNSYIVSGPDQAGAYIVDIQVPDQLSETQFIDFIRKIDGVENATLINR